MWSAITLMWILSFYFFTAPAAFGPSSCTKTIRKRINLPSKLWAQRKDEGYDDREVNIDEVEELTPDLLSELEEGQPSEFAILKEVRRIKDTKSDCEISQLPVTHNNVWSIVF